MSCPYHERRQVTGAAGGRAPLGDWCSPVTVSGTTWDDAAHTPRADIKVAERALPHTIWVTATQRPRVRQRGEPQLCARLQRDGPGHRREKLWTVTEPVIVSDVRSLDLRTAVQPAYDRTFELQALYTDPRTGAEHFVVRYQPGTRAKWHRHSAAHTIVVLAGHLEANGQLLGPCGYAHYPGGTDMIHEPARNEGCTFVIIFDGPFDLELVDRPLAKRTIASTAHP